MKKILYPILGLCAAMFLGGCEDRLDIEQKGVISADDFYQTDDDAQNALNNLYQCFAYHIAGNEGVYVALPVLFNEAGDDMLAAGNMYGDNDFGAQINEFRYDYQNEVIKNTYTGLYAVVYDANTIIDRVPDDSPIKKRVRAEAITLRAWAHMMLAIGWDCPPLVETVLPGDARPSNYEGGHVELLRWCAEQAESVVNDLEERISPTDKVGASKVTKGMALTVAGKARLFMGDYENAKKDLKQVISSNKYELVPTDRWANLFHTSGDLCEEMIFQSNCLDNANVGDWGGKINRTSWMWIQFWNWRTDKLVSRPKFIGADGWGGHSIRADFAERMLANDGDSPRRKATFMTPDEFFYEMEWTGTEGMTREQLETSDKIGIKDPTGLYGFGGYFAHKIVPWPEDNEKGWYGFKNLTIFRYAEVLLMYAEACAMTGDNDGLQYLNAIQNRAGSAHVSSTLTLDEVKNEKAFEMWIEGVRFPDMVRWGDTDGIVNNGKNIPSTYDAFFTKKEPKHRIYVEYSNPNKGQTGFVKGKHEYFPYPKVTISRNPNLQQNPSGL
ncbi:RagB/SusD family nutrient uptake outer membrane protein [uncultured Muribaculum sp.]|uniref:RagB/SusD family nutrient uptake outer membrane protein n=1 Tax=uncultured Muribaculum sp. TaxID=1918613 RepID=UPI00259D28DA|nr:RagB/SusD family nutrient uptake outer membrane protein [uncultured Muribaculum sp.]